MTLFYLYNVKHQTPMYLEVSSNDDSEYCSSVSAKLTRYGEVVWTTNNEITAKTVCEKHIQWYNSDIERPENEHIGDCEVRSIEL